MRRAAETEPIQDLRSVTARALAFTEGLCWDSLATGDAVSFSRQAVVCAELQEFGVREHVHGGPADLQPDLGQYLTSER